jgi:hypothetical protein
MMATTTAPKVPTLEETTATNNQKFGYAPVKQAVSDNSLVQNQLASITANGSKLNTAAETAATKMSNRRGLLNSSIAVGAAQDAVIRNALPVAQQDAATYANKDVNDTNAQNVSSQFAANSKNADDLQTKLAQIQASTQFNIANLQSSTQQNISRAENQNRLSVAALNAKSQQDISALDSNTKLKLAEIDGTNKQLLQTNISAANSYAQLAQALANISTSTTMDAAAKQQATDNQLNLFRQNLQAIGQVSSLDLSKYFQPVSTSQQGGTNTNGGGANGGADQGRPGMNGSLTEWG